MAILSKGTTFNNGDTVTSSSLNELVDQAAFVSGTNNTTDNVTLEVHSSGYLKVKTIASGNIGTDAVTTDKIQNSSSTTTGVTNSKLRYSAGLSVIGRSASSSGVVADITAGTDGHVLRRFTTTATPPVTTIGFGQIATAGIADDAVTPAKLSQPFTRIGNEAATGADVAFTGIPSWVNRVTVILDGVSLSGSADFLIQLGTSSSYINSGYSSKSCAMNFATSTIAGSSASNGFVVTRSLASNAYSGLVHIMRRTADAWVASGTLTDVSNDRLVSIAGDVGLGDDLTRLRIIASSGTFDAGNVNIAYE